MVIDANDTEEMIKEHLSEEQYDVVCDLANFYNSRKDKIKSITFGYRRPWRYVFVSFRLEGRGIGRGVLFDFNADIVSRDFEEAFLYKIHKSPKTKLFPDDKTENKEFTEFPDNEEDFNDWRY